jgi:hypothetical protein
MSSENLNSYPISSINKDLAEKGYAYIPNFMQQDVCLKARDEYFSSLANLPLYAQDKPFDPKELHYKSWRKTAIGSSNGVGEKYSQILQTTYIPFKSDDFKNLNTCFQSAILLRNQLTNMDDNFGSIIGFETGTYWNASRIHHYPCGGGHMAEHADTHFPSILSKASIPFVQVAVLLSDRNTDFRNGGGFVIDRNNKKVFFENDKSMGAAIIFDGSLKHGVEEIDLDQVLDWSSTKGRIALFSNLYVNR